MMETPESVETSVLFESLHDPIHKTRAILVFSHIRDMYREVPAEVAWIEFMDNVCSLVSAPDSLLQFLDRHCSSCQLRQHRVLTELSSQHCPAIQFADEWLAIHSANEHLAIQFADNWVSRFSMPCKEGSKVFKAGMALGFKIFKAGRALEAAATSKIAVFKAGMALGFKIFKAGRALETAAFRKTAVAAAEAPPPRPQNTTAPKHDGSTAR